MADPQEFMQLDHHAYFGLHPGSISYFGDQIVACELVSTLRTTSVPITPDQPHDQQRKSAEGDALAVTFYVTPSPSGLWRLLWDARRDDTTTTGGRKPGEVWFQMRQGPGSAHSSTNPEFSGWATINRLSTGGNYGRARVQSQQWPARAVTIL